MSYEKIITKAIIGYTYLRFKDCLYRFKSAKSFQYDIFMQRGGFVYIMASPNKTTLYVGVTSDLKRRIVEHREKKYANSFTSHYNCVMLVYYSCFERINEAIAEEKRIKGGNRKQREILINKFNNSWIDLWESIKNWDGAVVIGCITRHCEVRSNLNNRLCSS